MIETGTWEHREAQRKASGWAIKPAWLVWCDCGRFEGGHWAEQGVRGESLCKWLKSGNQGVSDD